jgi:hypothetical protein
MLYLNMTAELIKVTELFICALSWSIGGGSKDFSKRRGSAIKLVFVGGGASTDSFQRGFRSQNA